MEHITSRDLNRVKKSKNELIRENLGELLMHKNFVHFDKFHNPYANLTQTKKQFMFNKMIEKDMSRVNSFSYSNVLCLTSNHATVDMQFAKFSKFVLSQSEPIKTELSNTFGPLICHLYIDLVKSKDWKPAKEFLRKYCYLVAPVEYPDTYLEQDSNDETENTEPAFENTTRIKFSTESTGNYTQDHFKELIQTLSQCLNSELFDNILSITLFRSSKYEVQISLTALKAMKNYLETQGHLIILNVFHLWFNFEISELKGIDLPDNSLSTLSYFITKEQTHQTKINCVENHKKIDSRVDNYAIKKETDKKSNVLSQCLQLAAAKLQKIVPSSRKITVIDRDRNLTSICTDKEECHIAAGFDNSLVKLWPLNQSICSGSNIYKKNGFKCDWDFDQKICSEDNCDIELKQNEDQEKIFNILEKYDESKAEFLYGHNKGVTDILFSKRHPILLTVSKDHTMRLWKPNLFKSSVVYRGHNYPIWCVDENPLGMYVATGSRDLTARLWSLERQFPLITFIGHTQDVDCIAFHPNGNYLATGSCDLSIRLWSVTSGRLFRVFTDCKFPITHLAFSPNGKYLAAAGEENKVRIFDLAAGLQITESNDHDSNITDISWNTDGKIFATCCSAGLIRLWDVNQICSSDNKSSSFNWSFNHSNRPIKISFNAMDMLTCIGCSF